jgi:two-component system, NtrC family, response regulator HydG
MDIAMPEKNGVESFFEIRKFKPKARIYMMTGYSMEGLAEQAIDQGALGVLHKPFDIDKVLCLLEAVNPPGVIVLVEDDPACGATVCEMLTKRGHKAELARSGNEAADRARTAVPDVLVLNLGLPLSAGLDICKALRREGLMVPTIIIAASGDNSDELAQGLHNTTPISILAKPYDPTTLLRQLEGVAA